MSPNPVKPGDVLAGKYRVERLLGSGGMGYVVSARHLQLDQLVAMKFLKQNAIDNAEASERFFREAKAAAKLRSENIAKIHDVGTLETGEPYIVMEHLDGYDLAALAKRGEILAPSVACEYVMQACEALAEAHTLGIVHRDIKLANLFVTTGPTGAPLLKVLDFGISKTNPFGESEHEMTKAASLLGSPRFMSPEQMRDPRAVDGRTDIWSLGVVLYRLVAGQPPFEAEALGRLLTMVMHEKEAPLSTIRSDLPPGFEAVVARCLEKAPDARFADVAELAAALVPFCDDETRARSALDRISAVLTLPMRMRSGLTGPPGPTSVAPRSVATSLRGRVSVEPAEEQQTAVLSSSKDTGTAAPWAGAPADSRVRAPVAAATLGVLFAMVLVGAGVIAKAHHDQSIAARRATSALEDVSPGDARPIASPIAAASAKASALATVATTTAPLSPPPAASPPLSPLVPAAAPASAARGIGASTDARPDATKTPETKTPEQAPAPKRASAPSPRPRPNPSAATRPVAVAPAPPKRESGIPATRD